MPSTVTSNSPKDCPAESTLIDFLQGDLAGDGLDSVVQHIDDCGECQTRIELLDQAQESTSVIDNPLRALKDRTSETDRALIEKLAFAQHSRPGKRDGASPAPNQIGNYRILTPIGRGGMSEVYHARHLTLGRDVAVKLIGNGIPDRAQAARVLGEWRTHGQLMHPRIVTAFDAGLHDGQPYLVMEFVRGMDLGRFVASHGTLSIRQGYEVIGQVAEALQHAHERGIAHLDIKPSNIMLDTDGKIRLLDLGTAQVTRAASGAQGALPTSEGVVGTLAYLAPERLTDLNVPIQQQPDHADECDLRQSDIYSLGCTFFFLLTGEPPFGRVPASASLDDARKLFYRHRNEDPPPLEEPRIGTLDDSAVEKTECLVKSMMQKSPVDRCDLAGLQREIATVSKAGDEDDSLLVLAKHLEQTDDTQLVGQSGQTVQLTDLVGQDRESPHARHRWTRSAAILAAMAVLVAFVALPFGVANLGWFRGQANTSVDSVDTGAGTGKSNVALTEAPVPLSTIVGADFPPLGVSANSISSPPIPKRTIASPSTVENLQGQWRPRAGSGYFYKSHKLFASVRKRDPTVQAVALKTTAVRQTVSEVLWSPDGNQLAVLSRIGELRIYDWDQNRLTLRTVFRSNDDAKWINCICWHPTDGTLITGTNTTAAILTISKTGKYDTSELPIPPSKVLSVDTLIDGEYALVVVSTGEGIFGWDPETETVIKDFLPKDAAKFNSGNQSNRFVFHTDRDIQSWEAEFVVDSQSSEPSWKFRKLASKEVFNPQSSLGLEISSAGAQMAVIRPEAIYLRKTESLDRIGRLAAPSPPTKRCSFRFFRVEKSVNYSRSVISAQESIYSLEAVLVNNKESGRAFSTESLGHRLRDAVVDTHPNRELIAVGSVGGLEIWNSKLETVFQVPTVANVDEVIPLQTRAGCLILANDGSGIVLSEDGKRIATPIAPFSYTNGVAPKNLRHAFVEPENLLFQTASSQNLSRRYEVLDIEPEQSATDDTDKRATFSLVPARYRESKLKDVDLAEKEKVNWAFSTFLRADDSERKYLRLRTDNPRSVLFSNSLNRLAQVSSDGHFRVYQLDNIFSPPVATGNLTAGKRRCIAMSPDATKLYAANSYSGYVLVEAVDIKSGKQVWSREISEVRSTTGIVALEKGLMLCNWYGWPLLDYETGANIDHAIDRPDDRIGVLLEGKPQRMFDPRVNHGIRHNRVVKSPVNDVIYSWHFGTEIGCVAAWNLDLELLYIVIPVSNQNWLVLSPTGEIMHELEDANTTPNRFVRNQSGPPYDAKWAQDTKPSLPFASESLTIVKYHEDGRITCEPFNDN